MSGSLIPFPAWTPDLPEQEGGATVAQNVVPAEGRYRPVLSPVKTGNAVSGCVLSDYTAKEDCDACGPIKPVYVGTTEGVWRDGVKVLDQSAETWDFQQYGAEVFGTNGECLFTFPLSGGSGVAVEGAPKPFGSTIARVRDFLIATDSERVTGTPNPSDWEKDTISEEVFEQPIERDYGCVKAVTGGQSASVFTDCSIQRFDYTGGTFVFRRTPVETERGLVNADSLVEWGQSAYGLFTDGFGIWDGSRLINIDENQVREWAKRHGFNRPIGAIDATNRIIAWANGDDLVLLYSWTEKRWSLLCLPFNVAAIGEMETREHIGFRFWSEEGEEYALTGPNMEAIIETAEICPSSKRAKLTEFTPAIDLRCGDMWGAIGGRANCEGDCIEYSAEKRKGRKGTINARKSAKWMRFRMRIEAGASWTHARGVYL